METTSLSPKIKSPDIALKPEAKHLNISLKFSNSALVQEKHVFRN